MSAGGTSPMRDRPFWLNVALVVALAAAFLFPSFLLRDLWPPDEVRYMQVAREMAVTGDYLVPHLNGRVYAEKPPLFFWLAAGLYQAGFGFNGGRAVAAFAAMGTLILVCFYARRMMPGPGVLLSALVTLTASLFFTTKGGVIDPLVMFFTVAALWCGYSALQPGTRRRAAWWLGFYTLAALGVLTKGPVGLCVPGLVVLTYGLVNRKRVQSGGWVHMIGALVFAAIVCAWLIPAMVRGGPAYAREIGIDQTVERLTASRAHAQPFYQYLLLYPAIFFPWSLLFPIAFASAVLEWKREHDDGAVLLVLWFAVVFIFFSLISGKREGYLMPLLPALGLTVGRYVSYGSRDGFRWPRVLKWLARITFAAQGAAALVLGLFLLPSGPPRWTGLNRVFAEERLAMLSVSGHAGGILTVAGLLGLSVIGICLVKRIPRGAQFVWCIIISWLLVSLAADFYVAPMLNRLKSPRPFSEQAKPYIAQADETYLLANDMAGVHNLYAELTAAPVLPRGREALEVMSGRGRVAVIAREHVRREVFGEPCGYAIPVRERVGGTTIELIINWDPATGRIIPAPPAPSQATVNGVP